MTSRKPTPTPPPSLSPAVLFAFFVSGMAALCYQVLWMRQLGLVLGSTMEAAGLVLAAFMGGLALGSWLFGFVADRVSSPKALLGVFALLELGEAVGALIFPLGLGVLDKATLGMTVGGSPTALVFAAEFLGTAVLLLIPTTCMGGTLPVLMRFYHCYDPDVARSLSRLYGINTLGAMVGCLLAGFVLLPRVGLPGTLLVAVCLTATALVSALIPALTLKPVPVSAPSRIAPATASSAELLPRWLVMLAAGVSGFAALFLEVAWSRALVLVLGGSAYSSTLMLFCILAGIAIGGLLAERLGRRLSITGATLGGLYLGLGFLVGFSLVFLGRAPLLFVTLFPYLHESFGLVTTLQLLVAVPALLPATLLMGVTLPLLTTMGVDEESKLASEVGGVYAVNTLASVGGSLLAGFLAVPMLGTPLSITIGGALYLLLGALFVARASSDSGERARLGVLSLLGVGFLVVVALMAWDRRLMSSGVYMYAGQLQQGFDRSEVVFYREGRHCLVAVTRHPNGTVSLKLNGKTDGSNANDMVTQVLLSVLPLSFTEQANSVLVIGAGTGISVGTALQYPIERVVCLEIEPAVIEASKLFASLNGQYWKDRRTEIVTDDARSYLRASAEQFDVIISEPSNPWIRGVSNLFTVENFRIYSERLRSGGVICQWLQLYQMREEDIAMVMATFREVFPGMQVYRGSVGDLLLLARKDAPLSFPLDHFIARNAGELLGPSLQKLELDHPISILRRFVIGPVEVDAFTLGSRLNTDDTPYLEFAAARNLYEDRSAALLSKLKQMRSVTDPPVAVVSQDAELAGRAYYNWVQSQLLEGEWGVAMAEKLLAEGYRLAPDYANYHYLEGLIAREQQDWPRAEQAFRLDMQIHPEDPRALRELILVARQQGQDAAAQELLSEALRRWPYDPAVKRLENGQPIAAP